MTRIILIKTDSIMSVSYTHLDVYKRQTLHHAHVVHRSRVMSFSIRSFIFISTYILVSWGTSSHNLKRVVHVTCKYVFLDQLAPAHLYG